VPLLSYDPDLLGQHYDDHGREFRATSEAHYEELASNFLSKQLVVRAIKCNACSVCNCTAYGLVHECLVDGDRVRFDPVTNEFAVHARSGYIRTYFSPDPAFHGGTSNLKYFHYRCEPARV
jgi:hypothetical protein